MSIQGQVQRIHIIILDLVNSPAHLRVGDNRSGGATTVSMDKDIQVLVLGVDEGHDAGIVDKVFERRGNCSHDWHKNQLY
jgi:hypothetical protein